MNNIIMKGSYYLARVFIILLRVLIILAKVVINLTRVVFANRNSPGYSRYLLVDNGSRSIVNRAKVSTHPPKESIRRLFNINEKRPPHQENVRA